MEVLDERQEYLLGNAFVGEVGGVSMDEAAVSSAGPPLGNDNGSLQWICRVV